MMVFFKIGGRNSKVWMNCDVIVEIYICKWLVFNIKSIDNFFELFFFYLVLVEVWVYYWFKYVYCIFVLIKWCFVFEYLCVNFIKVYLNFEVFEFYDGELSKGRVISRSVG